MNLINLSKEIKNYARQQGFVLAGITNPAPPSHLVTYQNWIKNNQHADMEYLSRPESISKRANPLEILPECQSILMLGIPYQPANRLPEPPPNSGRVAAYACGEDYHITLPPRLKAIVNFIEQKLNQPVLNRYYTDTGPILERDLAQRAGLGWIGKNTCLISPKHGSYFLLAEILLSIALPADEPMQTDHCGTCTRCIEACPTQCILPNRTLDANRCISYLTIENKNEIPEELRPQIQNWVFGCDICQTVCPWNIRFAGNIEHDPAFSARADLPFPNLILESELTPVEYNLKYKNSPVKRAKRRGYLRNIFTALGNTKTPAAKKAIENGSQDQDPLIRQHAQWASERFSSK